MVKQIAFYADEVDENEFVKVIHDEGAVFLPSCHVDWPLPIIQTPLPSAGEPYMWGLAIWHPSIFSEAEMLLEENRCFNPAGSFYFSTLWPVLEYLRPHPTRLPLYSAALRFDATVNSFRVRTPLSALSPAALVDFAARAAKLELFYRRLCSWIRRRFSRVHRQMYVGESVKSRFPDIGSE